MSFTKVIPINRIPNGAVVQKFLSNFFSVVSNDISENLEMMDKLETFNVFDLPFLERSSVGKILEGVSNVRRFDFVEGHEFNRHPSWTQADRESLVAVSMELNNLSKVVDKKITEWKRKGVEYYRSQIEWLNTCGFDFRLENKLVSPCHEDPFVQLRDEMALQSKIALFPILDNNTLSPKTHARCILMSGALVPRNGS